MFAITTHINYYSHQHYVQVVGLLSRQQCADIILCCKLTIMIHDYKCDTVKVDRNHSWTDVAMRGKLRFIYFILLLMV